MGVSVITALKKPTLERPRGGGNVRVHRTRAVRYRFRLIGRFQPGTIMTDAVWIWNMSYTESRLVYRPKATAGTARVVP